MKNKIKSYAGLLCTLFIIGMVSCEDMEDNYQQYLDDKPTYSPKVTNLRAEVGLKEAVLKWELPAGDLAQKIRVDYQDSILDFNELIDSLHLENLEIKGYDIQVFTIDAFENLSVPAKIQIFPNGEN